MNISLELDTAFVGLRKSNILNYSRALATMLRTSAANGELISYIDKHATNVSLEDELANFAETHKFSEDPRLNLPFSYTVLYLLDSSKLAIEDLLSFMYPGKSSFDSYPIFINDIVNSIILSIRKADADDEVLGTENQYSAQPDTFDDFIETVDTNDCGEYADSLKELSNALHDALDEGDVDLVKSLYYGLVSMVNKSPLNIYVLDGIKSELMIRDIGV